MMKTVDRLFNKHMTVRKGYIDYMSRNAFHRAMEEYATQPASKHGESDDKCPKCGSKDYDEDSGVKRCQDCYTIHNDFIPNPTDFREKVRDINWRASSEESGWFDILVDGELAYRAKGIKQRDEFITELERNSISSLLPDVTEEDISNTFDGMACYTSAEGELYLCKEQFRLAILELFRKEGR